MVFLLYASVPVYTACTAEINDFHFSLDKRFDKKIDLQDDFLSEDLIEYDLICDRVVCAKQTLFKRACIKAYDYWYLYKSRVTQFLVAQYTTFKKYAYTLYLYLYKFNKRIKK